MDAAERDRKLVIEMLDQIFDVLQKQTHLLHELDRKVTMTQADIDALTQQVTQDRTAIATVVADLNALIAQGQPVDVSALQAAVDGLTSDITADTPPAPAPNPTPSPAPNPTPSPAPGT